MKTETVIASFLTFCMVAVMFIVFTFDPAASPQEKQVIYTLPEKTNMPCTIYKVDGAFVIIINDEELSK